MIEFCFIINFLKIIIINNFYGTNIVRTIQVQWCNKTSGLSIIVVKGSAEVVIN